MNNQRIVVSVNLKRTIKIMKLTVLMLVVCLSQMVAATYAQTSKLSVSVKNETLEHVLKQIEKQSEFLFFYNLEEINKNERISIDKRNTNISEILDAIAEKTGLKYAIRDRHIVLMVNNESPAVAQQSHRVTGVVKDAAGIPVIGANVVVKGTTNGTVTNIDGEYSLSVPSSAVLQISYIGYNTQEVTVGNKTVLNILLQEDSQRLNEVIVVGYGTQKKATLTGAVASVRSEQIANRAASDATNLLTGIAPGLTAIQRSGQPGADGAEFIIRGPGTLNSTSPLIIVDGIPGSLNAIDPNDIENISVLKDAASAAIYGVRAGNGVILVTTKKGKEGRMKVSYNGYIGFQNPTRLPKWVNSADYATLYNEALTNDGLAPKYSETDIDNYRKGTDPDLYPNSDQTDALFSKNGFQHSHHIQLDGGTEKTRYNFSLGYLNREGLIAQTDLERYSIRGNFDFDISKRVNFGVNFSYIRQEKSQPYQSISELVHRSYRETPVTPIKWSNGNWAAFMNEHNSVAEAENGGYDHYTDNFLTAIGTLEIKLIDGLSVKGVAAMNGNFTHTKRQQYNLSLYNAPDVVGMKFRPYLFENRGESSDINLQAFLNYNKTFGMHNVAAVLGYEQRKYTNSSIAASRYDLPENNLLDQINAGDASDQRNDGGMDENSIRSVFGRINYNFAERYLLEVTLRYDGSSRFPKNNRFELFPSVSAGWRISEEDFFNFDPISNLKLRASWGHLGNQEIGNYAYQNKYSLGRLYGFGNIMYSGIAENYSMSNSTIGWENTEMVNAGLDLNMLNNRLSFTFDYFVRNTRDILMSLPQPTILGAYAPVINAGAVRNKGFEMQLGWNDQLKDFNYYANLSVSRVKDKITDLKGADTPGRSVGDPINNIFGLEAIGLFASEEEIKNAPNQDYTGGASPGDIRYKDQNGDKKITAEDRVNLGNTFPGVTFGLQLGASYKGFDIATTIHAVADVQGYLTGTAAQAFANGASALEAQKDRWTPNNLNASYPRLSLNNASRNYTQTNSFFMENASYIKMRNLQIGYSLPKSILSNLFVEKCRFYVNADNLFTITSFRGFDPETPWGGGNIYPMVTSYTFGLNLVF